MIGKARFININNPEFQVEFPFLILLIKESKIHYREIHKFCRVFSYSYMSMCSEMQMIDRSIVTTLASINLHGRFKSIIMFDHKEKPTVMNSISSKDAFTRVIV